MTVDELWRHARPQERCDVAYIQISRGVLRITRLVLVDVRDRARQDRLQPTTLRVPDNVEIRDESFVPDPYNPARTFSIQQELRGEELYIFNDDDARNMLAWHAWRHSDAGRAAMLEAQRLKEISRLESDILDETVIGAWIGLGTALLGGGALFSKSKYIAGAAALGGIVTAGFGLTVAYDSKRLAKLKQDQEHNPAPSRPKDSHSSSGATSGGSSHPADAGASTEGRETATQCVSYEKTNVDRDKYELMVCPANTPRPDDSDSSRRGGAFVADGRLVVAPYVAALLTSAWEAAHRSPLPTDESGMDPFGPSEAPTGGAWILKPDPLDDPVPDGDGRSRHKLTSVDIDGWRGVVAGPSDGPEMDPAYSGPDDVARDPSDTPETGLGGDPAAKVAATIDLGSTRSVLTAFATIRDHALSEAAVIA
jgi:hypothetical protein